MFKITSLVYLMGCLNEKLCFAWTMCRWAINALTFSSTVEMCDILFSHHYHHHCHYHHHNQGYCHLRRHRRHRHLQLHRRRHRSHPPFVIVIIVIQWHRLPFKLRSARHVILTGLFCCFNLETLIQALTHNGHMIKLWGKNSHGILRSYNTWSWLLGAEFLHDNMYRSGG